VSVLQCLMGLLKIIQNLKGQPVYGLTFKLKTSQTWSRVLIPHQWHVICRSGGNSSAHICHSLFIRGNISVLITHRNVADFGYGSSQPHASHMNTCVTGNGEEKEMEHH
jgi:hypothetical protein